MDDRSVSEKLDFRYLPHVSQDLLGGRFPLGRTISNGSRAPWEPERYGPSRHYQVQYSGAPPSRVTLLRTR